MDPGVGIAIARLLGIALLALGVVCWLVARGGQRDSAAVLGMLIYKTLVAFFLAYLYLMEQVGGAWLWPAFVLHAVVALLLAQSRKQSM